MTVADNFLINRVERTVRKQNLFLAGDTLVVAVSGGADSSALLDLLINLPCYNLHLIVAHLNHCLRGDESDADENFCRDLASRYSLRFEERRIDINSLASDLHLNIEDAGRRARIEFFNEISRKYGAAAVVLAHHADDQAETVLMRLLRGSGMTGLSGMAYRNARGYVRPLLDITRVEIEQYLNERSLEWREDASNSDTIYLRNRIRHHLLPLLEDYNPAIRSCLATTASIISGDGVLLEELTERSFLESCRMGEGRAVFSLCKFLTLNTALQRRVLRHAFKQLTGTLEGVSARHLEAIFDLTDSDRPNSRLSLPQGIVVVREYDTLMLIRTGEVVLDTDYELLITEPGCYHLPSGGSVVVDLTSEVSFATGSQIACFDITKTPFPWFVRTFRPGDRITPFGMSGRKKVKEIFIDRKIPISERRHIPLVFCGDDLIWIAGVCCSELTRVCEGVDNAVKATLIRP
ncbi:MAG: tRNA lysidine(34) synthetase TilS [Geobacteraceae bacterium]|nr:tRNA lysidine(34) synthetase TilS [Geobacteraceae bacterium]NTW79496.1 tRNA lysidine(34) synthetase TilS [Geobacteraceae bacterium]